MKSLSVALSAALGAPVQQPGVLVQAGFDPVQRWSSHATLNWSGHTWTATPMGVDGLQVAALQVRGTLVLDNRDGVAGGLVVAQGVQDRAFNLWGFDAGAVGSTDIVWLANAIGAGVQVGDESVAIELRHRTELMVAPRTFVTEELLGPMLPVGTVLRINGRELTVSRRGNA
jgi:hypothetical protein